LLPREPSNGTRLAVVIPAPRRASRPIYFRTERGVVLDRPLVGSAPVRRRVQLAERRDYPPLEMSQMRRAIASNAFAALPGSGRSAVFDVYRAAGTVNYLFDKLLHLGEVANEHGATQNVRNDLRNELRDTLIPRAINELANALGRAA
jgi:hypothetical protein